MNDGYIELDAGEYKLRDTPKVLYEKYKYGCIPIPKNELLRMIKSKLHNYDELSKGDKEKVDVIIERILEAYGNFTETISNISDIDANSLGVHIQDYEGDEYRVKYEEYKERANYWGNYEFCYTLHL